MAERSKKRRGRTTSARDRVYAALEFVHLGFRDYVGARALLLADLPVQGATLASTAVEKYPKAFAAARGNVIDGHLRKAHVNLIRNYVPELFEALNPEFLSFLQRCYRLRYTDRLPAGFNIAVHALEVLAELDEVILRFERQMRFRLPSGEPIATAYRKALRDKHEDLYRDNHCLRKQPKAEFLNRSTVLYAMMSRGGEEGILEFQTVVQCPTDGHFERTGLRHATSEDFDGREPPPRTFKFPGDGGAAMRAARIPDGARRVRSFYFGATTPGSSAPGALMKCAFHEGDSATYFLAPATCLHLRDSFERALRHERFDARADARPDFLRNQPEIVGADWDVLGRQVTGCEVHAFKDRFNGLVDCFVLVLHLHENGQEKIALHSTLAPVMLGYLREIIDAVGMADPPKTDTGDRATRRAARGPDAAHGRV
jgi:hypothetical protein